MPIVDTGPFPQSGLNRSRAQMRAEMADYSGGANKPDVQAKADRAWDAAVRLFNRFPWTFNRVQQDIIVSSQMVDPLAPTVTNTGVGVGFTLGTAAQVSSVQYWIEERVKVGSQITRRSHTIAPASATTISASGTLWKAVIARGALQNADATHYAIFASRAFPGTVGVFPQGGTELVELPAATASFEDVRVGTNPEIPQSALIYLSGEYDLTSPFRSPVRAHCIDTEGRERTSITWIPWRQWAIYLSRITTASRPIFYTARNIHRTGRVIFHPRPASQMLWPGVRITYDTYIITAATDPASVLNVPMEIDQAIFDKATAIFLSRLKGPEAARDLHAQADELRMQLEQEYRDWEDS